MSLETELAANTAALTAQTAAIGELVATWKQLTAAAAAAKGADKVTAAGVTVIDKVEAPKPAPTPTATVTATPAPTEDAASTPAAASPSEPAKVELKDLSAAVTSAATRNRDGLVALLAKHNVKRASEVPQDKWAALIVELEAL